MEEPLRVFVTGATGTLGSALKALCAQRGLECRACAHTELDITHSPALQRAFGDFATAAGSAALPTRGLVINCAAYTDVDKAGDEEGRAFAVNAGGAANVATAAARHDLDLIHISTDYVFDGAKGAPYVEEDEARPLNAYGCSKLAGEQAVAAAHPGALIVRTSWLYGPGGTNFPARIVALARRVALANQTTPGAGRKQLEVVADQIGSPTAAADLAWGLLALYQRGAHGLFHLAGAGSCSRYELAQEVLAAAGLEVELLPTASAGFPTRATRPPYSVLDCSKARQLGVELPPWRESVRTFVREYLTEAAT